MNDILNEIYSQYFILINDLFIGYPISNESLNYIWSLIHKLHFSQSDNNSDPEILKLLEHYEYL
jgi:hypothetical protein